MKDNNKNEFMLPLEEWAELNRERHEVNVNDSRVIGFEFRDVYITNPYLCVSAVETVNPVEAYGELYVKWLSLYQEASTQNSHIKNSNS
jgi:hypothetical protein